MDDLYSAVLEKSRMKFGTPNKCGACPLWAIKRTCAVHSRMSALPQKADTTELT